MKATLLLALWIISINPATAQQVLFKNQPKDSVVRSSPRMAAYEYVPGEIIVKFKDNLTVKSTGAKFKSASTVTDALQVKYKVQKAEALFPGETRLKSAQMMTAPNGQKFMRPSLHNIYKLKIADAKQLMNAINDFKADSANVLYAEPNYIVSICDDKPVGPILTEADVQKIQKSNLVASYKAGSDPIVNDPLYNKQWYIPEVKIDLVWPQTKGDSTQIIAILDTGVDWLHPDLKNKIWMNPNPSNNSWPDGIVNDIHGWDFINNDNDPMDDNSHGTHVAGIAAAETNNEVGIAGVCPNAKIMPIKVFQSSGRSDNATIVKGINYAATHGATVINMSFGSYARSLAMEDALANAYATCVLVAAVGNDGFCIGPRGCQDVAPFFPAAISFVLGVQAPEASFSNFDQDGPTFSLYSDLLNYEMKAPGTNILSTVPNGGYRVYQGTSMAAPIISGAIALYKKIIPDETQEFMWVKLIQATEQHLDLNKALTIIPKPEVLFLNNVMVDTLGLDDRDGLADAGETIQLWFKARNTGGQADSVYWKIRLADFEDKTTCDIVKPTSFLNSISPYATITNEIDPMKFIINKNVAHDRDITFSLLSWYKGASDTLIQKYVLKVENGQHVSGLLLKDTVFTPDRLWLINGSLRINTGVTLTILPGTHVEINSNYVDNRGTVKAIGTADSLIYLKNGCIGNNSIYKYVSFDLNGFMSSENTIEHCIVNGGTTSAPNAISCIFNNSQGFGGGGLINCLINNSKNIYVGAALDTCVIYNSSGYFGNSDYLVTGSSYTVFDKTQSQWFIMGEGGHGTLTGNSFLSVGSIVGAQGKMSYLNLPDQYWGTMDSLKIRNKYIDFVNYSYLPYLIIDPISTSPSNNCHAHVWKILVNGKDAQDEVVEPLGIGKQRFDVYFNRSMDKTKIPQVSFGVRYPFSSNTVDEEGSWSTDGRIYTSYKTIKLTTGDGINRIRVSGAKEANGWEWEITLEDTRFNFLISAAGSSSAEFVATPGLGKVKMEWNNNTLSDGLGFNMYRMEDINDSTLTQPVLINKSLIADTLYTDYDVTPNKKYYYYYKVLRTNLTETDSSRIVSAVPFTAQKGDANGDLDVSVLDIISIVSYLLGQDPTPFIFEAADVNADMAVNVLDVVSVANIIKTKSAPVVLGKNFNPTLAYITLKPEIIQLKSDAQVQAIQFELQGIDLEKVKLSAAIKGFELAYSIDSNKIKGVLYNLNGQTIPAGITDVIKIESGAGSLTWGEVFGADPQGQYVTILKKVDVSLNTETSPFGLSVQPNPSGSDMHISFTLPEKANVTVKVFNLLGEMVSQVMDNTLPAGNQQIIWNGTNGSGETVKPGVYFIRVDARGEKNTIFKENIKIVRF